MELLYFEPDSTNPITENIVYNTDVIESFDGTEQRIPLLQNPRLRFSYYYTLYANELQKFNNFVFRNQSKTIYVPVWNNAEKLTAKTNVNSNVFKLSYDRSNMNIGEEFVVMNKNNRSFNKIYKILNIDKISKTITTTTNSVDAWDIDDVIVSVVKCQISDSIQKTFSAGSDRAAGVNITFQKESDNLNYFIDGAISYPKYRDLYIIDKQPNKTTQLNQRMQRKLLELDLGYGITYRYDKSNQNFDLFNYNWTLKNREEINNFKAFANEIKGKLSDFWFPTFQNDMTILEDYDILDDFILIENIGLQETYLEREIHIKINLKNGEYFLKEVLSIEDLIDKEKLNLISPMPQSFTVDEVDSINLIWRCRFNNDEFLLTYSNRNVAQISKSAFMQKF